MAVPHRTARIALAVLGWLAAACVAVAVGLVAVSALGRGVLASGPPLTEPAEVEAELARPASPAPADPAPESPATDRPPARDVERTPGGSVVTGCDESGRAVLLSWSPAQGFRVDDVDDVPESEAELTFESRDATVDVSVSCTDGNPVAKVEVD
ncbi:hypothetical protein [Saccharopolyspora griseoalba]|uniref:Septum formation initiator n=1 Tax=Saccharopolyspora griseoalba TaxID=1431848 RepID=A0ABW2LPE1_9PSEU